MQSEMCYGGITLREFGRKCIHILFGLFLIFLLTFLERELFLYFLFFVFIVSLSVANIKLIGRKVPIVDFFLELFERKNVIPTLGTLWYINGILLSTLLLYDADEIIAVLIVLALGDGFSNMFGRFGKWKIPYNVNKTVEGSSIFFIFSLLAYLFIGELAIPFALLMTLVESLPLSLDDNLVIPLVASIFFYSV